MCAFLLNNTIVSCLHCNVKYCKHRSKTGRTELSHFCTDYTYVRSIVHTGTVEWGEYEQFDFVVYLFYDTKHHKDCGTKLWP